MAVLRIVTLVYASILVLALAVTLVTIAVYLWRIAAVLDRVRQALAEVRVRTAPLEQHLGGLEALTERRVGEYEHSAKAIENSVGIDNEADRMAEEAARL